jgi:hypothetical protein
MVDKKLSELAAAVGLNDADLLLISQSGLSKSATLNLLTSYIESRGRQMNASVANQAFTTADTYITGSDVAIPAGRLQAKSMYRLRFQLTKTSAGGVAAPVVTIRVGTAGAIGDTARVVLTFAAQTAVADAGFIDVYATFRVVGAAAVLQGAALLDHQLAATGLSTSNTSTPRTTSGTFDSTVANLRIGCSFNGGAAFAGNADLVQAELMNLA